MKCPTCKEQFPLDMDDVYEGLSEFLVRVGVKDVGIVLSSVGKGIYCDHCLTPLWVPIRGDPVRAVLLFHGRTQNSI